MNLNLIQFTYFLVSLSHTAVIYRYFYCICAVLVVKIVYILRKNAPAAVLCAAPPVWVLRGVRYCEYYGPLYIYIYTSSDFTPRNEEKCDEEIFRQHQTGSITKFSSSSISRSVGISIEYIPQVHVCIFTLSHTHNFPPLTCVHLHSLSHTHTLALSLSLYCPKSDTCKVCDTMKVKVDAECNEACKRQQFRM